MEKRADKKRRQVAMLHQLSERLTAAGNYLEAVQRRPLTEARHTSPPSTEILQRALAQFERAREIVGQLRKSLGGDCPAASGASHSYRVCFMNRFARGRNTITACQRSIVIPSAQSREAAIEVAKERFAELEGVPDWTLHATFIEAGLLEEDLADHR